MTPVQWEQTKRLFLAALEREPALRADFLAESCRGDAALLREVESLLAAHEGDEAFIGVSRSARSKDGASMVDLAKLHEFGGAPVIIPMTPKMRRFLFALLRQAGKEPTGGSGRGVIFVQVPARPFLRPAFDKFREGASRRFLERVARELGLAP